MVVMPILFSWLAFDEYHLLESMFMAHPQAGGVGESPDPVA